MIGSSHSAVQKGTWFDMIITRGPRFLESVSAALLPHQQPNAAQKTYRDLMRLAAGVCAGSSHSVSPRLIVNIHSQQMDNFASDTTFRSRDDRIHAYGINGLPTPVDRTPKGRVAGLLETCQSSHVSTMPLQSFEERVTNLPYMDILPAPSSILLRDRL